MNKDFVFDPSTLAPAKFSTYLVLYHRLELPKPKDGLCGDLMKDTGATVFEIAAPRLTAGVGMPKPWQLMICSLVLAFLFISVNGCDPVSESSLANNNSLLGKSSKQQQDSVIHDFSFGVVPTGQSVSHIFQLSNETEFPQTIQDILMQCSCTIADVSSKVIQPHGSVDMRVQLRTGNREADLQKQVLVKFAEQGAQPHLLRLAANVRNPMSLQPNRIIINSKDTASRKVTSNLTVRNYTDRRWRSLTFNELDEWVVCSAWEAPVTSSDVKPLQVWRVTVQCDTSKVENAYNETSVVIRADEDGAISSKLGIVLTVQPSIKSTKQGIHFGSVTRAELPQEEVRFEFANNVAVPKPEINLHSQRAELFDFRWQPEGAKSLELSVGLRPAALHVGDVITETIDISFPLADHSPIVFSFPITARISN